MSRFYKRKARQLGSGRQCGALPWRRTQAGVEVMLITSRETRRWTVPKGWPMKKLTPQDAAALEAFEEAGVRGAISPAPIGVYPYPKRLRDGTVIRCDVDVFALQVANEAEAWPEQSERDRAWLTPAEAAERVLEPELKALILAFAPA